jgi:hypothetical protein
MLRRDAEVSLFGVALLSSGYRVRTNYARSIEESKVSGLGFDPPRVHK